MRFEQRFIAKASISSHMRVFFGEYSNLLANEGCLTHFAAYEA